MTFLIKFFNMTIAKKFFTDKFRKTKKNSLTRTAVIEA